MLVRVLDIVNRLQRIICRRVREFSGTRSCLRPDVRGVVNSSTRHS